MAETIEGGATYDMATKRWINANGDPLSKEQAAEAERMAEEHAAQLAEAEKQARMLDAQRDPTARAIASALTGQQPQQAQAARRVQAPAEQQEADQEQQRTRDRK